MELGKFQIQKISKGIGPMFNEQYLEMLFGDKIYKQPRVLNISSIIRL